MAKNDTFKGVIETAYGEKLPKPLSFSGTYEAFETVDEIKDANEYPSNDEIVNFVNSKRKANARQKAMNEALSAAGIQKPTLDQPEVQVKTMVKALVASGKYTEEQATQVARQALGL